MFGIKRQTSVIKTLGALLFAQDLASAQPNQNFVGLYDNLVEMEGDYAPLVSEDKMNFHPLLSFTTPLKQNTFKNWQSEESTVFLQNKVILVPESLDKKGYLAMKYWFQADSWQFDINVEFDAKARGYQQGQFQIYMLKHKPDGEPFQFGKMDAALQESVVGLRFNINVNNRRAKDEDGKSIRRNEIEAKYFDERGTQLLNMNEAKCQISFKKAWLRLESDTEENKTRLVVKPDGNDEWLVCMELPFSVTYKVHTYLSGYSTVSRPSRMAINEIKFNDLDPPSAFEVELLKEMVDEGTIGDFHLEGMDLMHEGNRDAGLLEDIEKSRAAYNNELMRYNNQYSRLVGNFHANSDSITKIVRGLPESNFMNELQSKIYMFTGQQNQFQEHFIQAKKAIAEYSNKFLEMRKNKGGNTKNKSLDTDVARVSLQYGKIDANMAKLKRLLIDDDRIMPTIKKSQLRDQAKQLKVDELNDTAEIKSASQINAQKLEFVSKLKSALEVQIEQADYDSNTGSDLPIQMITVVAFLIIAAFGAFIFFTVNKQNSSSLPMGSQGSSMATNDPWGNNNDFYGRKEI